MKRGVCSADLHQPGLAYSNVFGLNCGRSFHAAVDEQNAQTQEQEMIVLGLSESEEKNDLKSEDTVCHSESCGVAKHRSLRKGIAASLGDPQSCHRPMTLRKLNTWPFPVPPAVRRLSGGRWEGVLGRGEPCC